METLILTLCKQGACLNVHANEARTALARETGLLAYATIREALDVLQAGYNAHTAKTILHGLAADHYRDSKTYFNRALQRQHRLQYALFASIAKRVQ